MPFLRTKHNLLLFLYQRTTATEGASPAIFTVCTLDVVPIPNFTSVCHCHYDLAGQKRDAEKAEKTTGCTLFNVSPENREIGTER
jgi:hypothetical protein